MSDEDNTFDGKHFVAGNNDIVDIEEILCDIDEINYYMNDDLLGRLERQNNYDISK